MLTQQPINKLRNLRIRERTHKNELNLVGGNLLDKAMFRAIDIWKQINDTTAIRYRCFQRLTDGLYCVQSADYYHLPIRSDQVRVLDQQFLELFLEAAPDKRSQLFSTLEEAIAMHDRDFSDDLVPDTSVEKIA